MEILPVENKKADNLDLHKPLKQFLIKHYGQDAAKDYESALQNIQQKRTALSNLQDKSESSRDLLLKYALELHFIERRFPVNGGGDRINLVFAWTDAFKGKKTSQGNIFYEQANVLFNAAAMESQIASAENRSTDDGIKNATKSLQNAASLFLHLKEKVLPKVVEKVPTDLTSECLDCLTILMLANAQQCVVEKAEKGKMKAAIISKLAMSASDFFLQAYKMMVSSALSDSFDKTWQGYTKFKELYFAALANYYVSVDLHANDEVGQEIARLNYALKLMNDAKNCKVSKALTSHAKTFVDTLNKALDAAEYDNQKVYHYKVPSFEELPAIEKKELAKTSPIDLTAMVTVLDPFERLYPIRVMEAKTRFTEQLNVLLAAQLKAAREHRDNIKAQLSSMGLPASILAAEQKQGFPAQVHEKIAKLNQSGGIPRLTELKTTVDDMANATRESVKALAKMLDEEQEMDKKCRDQFQSQWLVQPSLNLTGTMRKSIAEYDTKLQQAAKSDGMIDKKISDNQEKFLRFTLEPQELDKLMPNPDLKDSSDTLGKSFQDLKTFLSQMDQFFAEEEKIENAAKAMQQDDAASVETRFIEQQDNVDVAITKEIGKYTTLFANFVPLQQEEDMLLNNITAANQAFTQSRHQSNSLQKREAIIQDMYAGINKFDEILANLQEGIRFYTQMQDIVKKLQQKVSDFVVARRLQREDLIANIQSQVTGMNVAPIPYQQPQQQGKPPQYVPQNQPYYNPSAPPQQQGGYNPQYGQPPQYAPYQQPPQYAPYQGYQQPPQQQAYNPQYGQQPQLPPVPQYKKK